jgi:hypothetical protein
MLTLNAKANPNQKPTEQPTFRICDNAFDTTIMVCQRLLIHNLKCHFNAVWQIVAVCNKSFALGHGLPEMQRICSPAISRTSAFISAKRFKA